MKSYPQIIGLIRDHQFVFATAILDNLTKEWEFTHAFDDSYACNIHSKKSILIAVHPLVFGDRGVCITSKTVLCRANNDERHSDSDPKSEDRQHDDLIGQRFLTFSRYTAKK